VGKGRASLTSASRVSLRPDCDDHRSMPVDVAAFWDRREPADTRWDAPKGVRRMPVTSIRIDHVQSYADGATFGRTGPYEVVRGRVRLEVDPLSPTNVAITDLERVPRNLTGMVAVESDVLILRPVDAGRGNGCVLTVAPNRGGVGHLPFSTGLPLTRNQQWLDPGDAFLLRHGWTLVWIGWQWDISRDGTLLGCTVPEALDDQGRPLTGWTSVRIEPTRQLRCHPLNELTIGWTHDMPAFTDGAYRTADVDDPTAILTFTEPGVGSRTVPRRQWRFADDDGDGPVTSDRYVWLAGGFKPGLRYELTYRTCTSPVVGLGLLAVREVAAFLRYGTSADGNPLADLAGARFLAFGVSQSGRFLLEYLHSAGNADGQGRRVFDVVLPFVAGSNRGQFNQRFGKPGAIPGADLGELPPYALNGRDGILTGQQPPESSPRVIAVNSGTEYWRGDAGHAHLSTDGTRDLPDDPMVRIYLIAGTDHTGGAAGQLPGQVTPPNRVDPTHVWRAVLEGARRWVVDEVPPPASRVPRLADGSAVPRERVLERFGSFPHVPTVDEIPQRHEHLFGPDAARGVVPVPVPRGGRYAVLVSDVDETLNESAGIRLPQIQFPKAIHTPWSSPRDLAPARVLAGFFGYSIPMPAGELPPDPARGDRSMPGSTVRDDARLANIRMATAQLIRDGFLLPEDEDAAVAQAMAPLSSLTAEGAQWSPSNAAGPPRPASSPAPGAAEVG
jgi:hypothetical protein